MARAPIQVACAGDANFALPLAVMLESLAASLPTGGDADAFVLENGIPSADRHRIAQAAGDRVHVHWIPAGELPPGLLTWGRVTLTTYYKVTVAEWVPAEVRRIMWLDADLLIRADLTPLWELPFGTNWALAAIDERTPTISSKGGVAAWRECGIDPGAPHFNAGVMLIDLDAWRREEIAARAFDYLQRFAGRVYFYDQEGLNAALAGRCGAIDIRWNQHPGLGKGKTARDNAFIHHFSGNLKPWTFTSPLPAWAEYYRHLDRTPWKGWRPEPTLRGRFSAWYQASAVRRLLYPTEAWAMQALRFFTKSISASRSGAMR